VVSFVDCISISIPNHIVEKKYTAMETVKVIQPIKTTLAGSNYAMWSQEMSSFLKEKRLW